MQINIIVGSRSACIASGGSLLMGNFERLGLVEEVGSLVRRARNGFSQQLGQTGSRLCAARQP